MRTIESLYDIFECQICQTKVTVWDSCGNGTTWSLFQCSSCEQLYAKGEIIPQGVIDDEEIIINK